MKKCKVDCIRKSTNLLTEEDLLRIVEMCKIIKLTWKDKYVEFNYAKPEEDPFSPKGFYPYSGSWEILGTDVPIQTYSISQFLDLYKTSDELIAVDSDTSNVGICNELFQTSDVRWYVDYSRIISYLEEKRVIRTFASENWLSVDGRKFKIKEKALYHVPLLKDYVNEYYEVDSLGTMVCSDLTSLMELLCETLQKSLK